MKRSKVYAPIRNGKCKFCGADNNEKEHIFIGEEDGRVFAYCNNCSARTEEKLSQGEAVSAWNGGHYTIQVQTERQIYDGCLSLMQGLVDSFKEWLEWQGIETPEEERFRRYYYPAEIVNRLFLYHTYHSGGTSTRAKCHELGIEDPTRLIEFKVEDEEDE